MRPGNAMLYLSGAAVLSTLLGIIITFLPVGLYEQYLHPVDELGALNLIRNTWGISAAEDQRLAGLPTIAAGHYLTSFWKAVSNCSALKVSAATD